MVARLANLAEALTEQLCSALRASERICLIELISAIYFLRNFNNNIQLFSGVSFVFSKR